MENSGESFQKIDNIRYKAGSANKNVTTTTELGSFIGSYEYKPMEKAVQEIPDPYNIFPKIESLAKESNNLSNREITQKIADIINQNTNIPVIIEDFKDYDQPYSQLENGYVYFHKNASMGKTYGIHSWQYPIKDGQVDFKNPKGDVILLNQLLIDDPNIIKTAPHELGHIVEEKILDPEQERTEVISSLYGYKVAKTLGLEEVAQKQKDLYDYVLTENI